MIEEIVKAYVTKADGEVVRVKLLDSTFEKDLLNLGFSFDAEFLEYAIQASNDTEKANLFNMLRNLDVSFSSGKEWCPSEVFEYLRELGLISGDFKRISWRGPGKFYITVE